MKFRAVAAASSLSNAVGTVELECTPHGLSVVYLGVGAYAEGFAPGALTHGTGVLVPWNGVKEARLQGDRLYLALDPGATPHHRLWLANFSTGDLVHERELFRQRAILRRLDAVCGEPRPMGRAWNGGVGWWGAVIGISRDRWYKPFTFSARFKEFTL